MREKYRIINRIGNTALDLLYPKSLYCISCGKIIDDSRTYRLCNECMAAMNWNTGRRCSRCGKMLAETDPGSKCFDCKCRERSGADPFFDKGYACSGYGACEQAMIFSLKYGSRSDIADTIGEIMYDRMTAEFEPEELAAMYDLVIPVPINREKKKKRGFNHADLIARSFAGRAGLRFDPDIVVRARDTMPMKGLRPGERRYNIKGAFRLRKHRLPQVKRANVLIVDDIFTTGATIDEIARLLKEPEDGASRVDFIAFAGSADYLSS